ncbi:hypothetical protein E4O73_09630 [Neisseria meningitidis]|nr:hypothetical protein [Neisseria meningitidis]MBG8660416.1 hypothetical protein [Neisseria meningitidis]MBG8671912.1 hypothetical protein [Neisseria meningitidis]MBG8673938.1 hypothetical protein [Neisseria meningitidis]MBG8676282.1 hypothetical protein [Neisseria meningitidis]
MLKKIKKALFQPKKFFQDSMWLTTSPFYLTPHVTIYLSYLI